VLRDVLDRADGALSEARAEADALFHLLEAIKKLCEELSEGLSRVPNRSTPRPRDPHARVGEAR
jgi:hypothetical protein